MIKAFHQPLDSGEESEDDTEGMRKKNLKITKRILMIRRSSTTSPLSVLQSA